MYDAHVVSTRACGYEANLPGRVSQGLLFWMFKGGFKVNSGPVENGIETVVVLTLILPNSEPYIWRCNFGAELSSEGL